MIERTPTDCTNDASETDGPRPGTVWHPRSGGALMYRVRGVDAGQIQLDILGRVTGNKHGSVGLPIAKFVRDYHLAG